MLTKKRGRNLVETPKGLLLSVKDALGKVNSKAHFFVIDSRIQNCNGHKMNIPVVKANLNAAKNRAYGPTNFAEAKRIILVDKVKELAEIQALTELNFSDYKKERK